MPATAADKKLASFVPTIAPSTPLLLLKKRSRVTPPSPDAKGRPASSASDQLACARRGPAPWILSELKIEGGTVIKLSEEKKAELRALHAQGLTDADIARLLGRYATTIQHHRVRLGLPANAVPGGRRATSDSVATWPDLKRRCLALLRRGIGARLIARESGASIKSLDRWRTEMLRQEPELRRPGTARRKPPRHPNGRVYSALRSDRRARAFALYADGLDDPGIAQAMGLRRQQIWEWRNALRLPATKQAPRPARLPKRQFAEPITPLSHPIHRLIVDAIGGGLAPDIRDEAVSEVWLALQDGRLSVDRVQAEANKFRRKALREFANPYGPRSLDEELGDDGDGLRMIDTLRDDRSSSWLEEMGATVW